MLFFDIYINTRKNIIMNTDKLVEAIQILVEQEVKRHIPIIRKQILEEIAKQSRTRPLKSTTPTLESLLSEEVEDIHEEVHYVKDPVLNKVLNETKRTAGNYPGHTAGQFDEYPTMKSTRLGIETMAEKMGYGDLSTPQKTGLGVKTGNDALDKAFNRDYTALVKRF